MRREPDPVAQAVAEAVAIPGRTDDVAGDRVDRPAGRQAVPPTHGAFERLHRGRLGVQHELVQRVVTLRWVADEQGPRHVAPIAGDLGAEVEEEDRTLEDRAIAGCSVRQSRLRARQTCDLEGQRLGAVGPHQPLEAKRERGLGHAWPDLREQRGERPVGDRARRCDPLELRGLLRRPVGLDPALDRYQLDIGCGGRQLRPGRLWHEGGLDPDALRAHRRDELRPSRRQVAVHGLDPASGASREAWIS